MTAPYWINPGDPDDFPNVSLALTDPDGLLAYGGDLSPSRLITAYRSGIFPWYSEGQPILWWSPDPRAVLFPKALHISKSLAKTLRKNLFTIKFDSAFHEVMQACAAPRRDGEGTWITDDMLNAYLPLHEAGYAHSVECWQDDQLVGGLYGIAIGKIFFGESMFARVTDASKVAFVHLANYLTSRDYALIDCQVETEHLNSLGASSIPRDEFIAILERECTKSEAVQKWDQVTIE